MMMLWSFVGLLWAEEFHSEIVWNEVGYQVITIDLEHHSIRLFGDIQENRTMKSVFAKAEKEGLKPLLAMNGGMFDLKQEPVGLFISQGKMSQGLNLRDGVGNFYLKPNGVFTISKDGKASIMESSKLLTTFPNLKDIELATQSGPLLLEKGEYHQAIRPKSSNKHIRNGVCVVDEEHLYFVISKEPVRFYDLASLMKEKLGCQDGLYLDGAISELQRVEDEVKSERELGPILLVSTNEPKGGNR